MKSLLLRAHTEPLFSAIELLNIYRLYLQIVLLFMFKYISGSLLPNLFISEMLIFIVLSHLSNINYIYIYMWNIYRYIRYDTSFMWCKWALIFF